MNTEIEAKFLHVNHDAIRQKLSQVGAMLEIPMRLMRRVTIDSDEMLKKNGFLRVRDEGNKVTLTYKQFDALSVAGAKEIEVDVSDFQGTIDLLAAAGLTHKSFQESKRETWRLGSTEIVLDEWPWLDPYIEIEGKSEADVRGAATQLGFNWQDAVFGDVMVAYQKQYPHLALNDTVGNIEHVKFGEPLPDLLKS